MKLIREHFHTIIFHNFRGGLPRQEYIDELKFLYGNKAASYSDYEKTDLINSNRGRRSLKNEIREGPPDRYSRKH